MATNKGALIVPGHGTLFLAPENTAVPANPLTAFSLFNNPPAGWENIGHTSKDNTPAFTRDGGDATNLDTFLQDNVRTIYDAVEWGLTINALQVDKSTLDLGYNGWVDTDGGYVLPAVQSGVNKALFLYLYDQTGSLGFYIPSATLSAGDVPTIDAANFFEIPLAAQIHPADATVIALDGSGRQGLLKWYKSTITASAPVIVSALPSGAATGALVTIKGYYFTGVSGASGVKFGGSNATNYTVVDDSTIIATMPTGSAGAANIVVTNTTGASAAFAYTRG